MNTTVIIPSPERQTVIDVLDAIGGGTPKNLARLVHFKAKLTNKQKAYIIDICARHESGYAKRSTDVYKKEFVRFSELVNTF